MSIKRYPDPLGSIFLTGPDGFVYEFPEAIAKQHRVTPERIKELGHLPILPYTSLVLPKANETDEVSARHFVLREDGQFGPHSELINGTAINQEDGFCYTGFHFHPDGSTQAKFINITDNPPGAHIS